jgi:excisionase family DNA binding protein
MAVLEYCTVTEATDITGLSRATIYRMIERHDLKASKPRGSTVLRIRLTELRACVEGRDEVPPERRAKAGATREIRRRQ